MSIDGDRSRVLLNSGTLVGRLYGQGVDDECLFDVVVSWDNTPMIQVRFRNHDIPEIWMPPGATLLVQLFEAPEMLWLAQAIMLQRIPMVRYTPLEALEATDRSCLPSLAEVTLDQLGEGGSDALITMEDRANQTHRRPTA